MVLHNLAPAYLSSLIAYYSPLYNLCMSQTELLVQLAISHLCTFAQIIPHAWNSVQFEGHSLSAYYV